jgi:hypothetical protein
VDKEVIPVDVDVDKLDKLVESVEFREVVWVLKKLRFTASNGFCGVFIPVRVAVLLLRRIT